MLIQIDQIVRSRRRSIGLEITSDARLIVRAPRLVSTQMIKKLVEQKSKWIKTKQNLLKTKQQELPQRFFQEGEQFFYLGKSFFLKIEENLNVPIKLENHLWLSGRYQQNVKETLKAWYKKEAYKKIAERVRFYYALTGLKYNQIKINNARRRWGSCSVSGNLNFTWRLIMAPEKVIDYVVVHEMIHLEIKNHSNLFWQAVEDRMPDYREHKNWLKQKGHLLVL